MMCFHFFRWCEGLGA